MKTCYSCINFRREPVFERKVSGGIAKMTGWRQSCERSLGLGRLASKCPGFEYEPGSDEEEDDGNEK